MPPKVINANWPDRPNLAHRKPTTPCAQEGDEAEVRRAFFTTYNQRFRRHTILDSLPVDKLDRADLNRRIDETGHKGG